MDDMSAFDRQLASVVRRRVGPSEPVDDLAVFESVTTASRSTRWGFTVFSALEFIAAAAVVALFGGFLLAGILSAPQGDEMAPAAVTAPPSSMTTEELLAGMVTEEVEPGVYRVLNDGVRELPQPNDVDFDAVVAGPDGSVWLGSTGRWLRLGDEAPPTTMGGQPFEFEVAPDGTLWGVTGGSLHSFDGMSWTEWGSDSAVLSGLAIAPDGTVWTTGGEAWGETTDLYRLTAEGLTAVPDWTDAYPRAAGPRHVVAAPDGAVWLIGEETPDLPGYDDGGPRVDALLRFDGSDWEVVAVPGDLRYVEGQSLDIGTDGTLWAAIGNPSEEGDGLARLDDSGWTVFTEADGVRPWGIFGFVPTDHLHAASDGSVWVNAEGAGSSCGGVANFDGMTWTGFLSDLCVSDMDISPDGAVWVRAGTFEVSGGFEYWDPPDTYVITPEAVAAKEAEIIEPPSAGEATVAEEAPTTTEDLLAGMVTEEVEPGVHRVVNDGVRDLDPGSIERLAVGTDGSVWAFGVEGFHLLGTERSVGTASAPGMPPHDAFGVGPDGTLWLDGTHWGPEPWEGLGSFDGEDWTRHRPEGIPDDHRPWGLHVASDGSVWILLAGRGQWQSGEALLARFDGDDWVLADFVPGAFPELLAGASSSVWAVEENVPPPRIPELHRFDDGRWVQQHVPAYLPRPWELVVGPDDTLWIRSWNGDAVDPASLEMSMAHFDGSEWRLSDESHFPTPGDTNLLWALEPMAAGPDGSLWGQVLWGTWVSPFSEEWSEPVCDGIAHFDGTTVSRYLEGLCIREIDAATDGSVWVLADDVKGNDLYVITPEAVAGTK